MTITWWWRHRILSFLYEMSGTFIPFICWAGIGSNCFGSLVIWILVVFWTLITWLWRHRAWPKFFKLAYYTAPVGTYNLWKFQVSIYFTLGAYFDTNFCRTPIYICMVYINVSIYRVLASFLRECLYRYGNGFGLY